MKKKNLKKNLKKKFFLRLKNFIGVSSRNVSEAQVSEIGVSSRALKIEKKTLYM